MDKLFQGFERGVSKAANLRSTKWVKWRISDSVKKHCSDCAVLDGCCFIETVKPRLPLHLLCQCDIIPVNYTLIHDDAAATSAFGKFDPYLFNRNRAYKHEKQKMFESWGYQIEDSAWMQKEFEKQALEKYLMGQYTLKKLNENGQHIDIIIELPRKKGEGTVSFVSGWMVRANGQITCNTPYGGK